jgi:hypothetical protein
MPKTRRRLRTQPWDLFHPPPQTPTWEELPRPMKRHLTELLARLLRDQRDQNVPQVGDKEVNHE